MNQTEKFIQRSFDLARLGAGHTHPNPLVGAVLVYRDRIIGEGYHRKYGGAHAEVNAVASVAEIDRGLITQSTLYVSLEPCNIYGRTPPCTDLILKNKIPRVVISCRDFTPGVNGSGVEKLRQAGVEVIEGVLLEKGKRLSLPRNTFVQENRPYIVLKYARTREGEFSPQDGSPFWISNAVSKRLVHKWRSESAAIMVGTNTAAVDNPALTTRYYAGPSPTRVVLDRNLRLPTHLAIFDGSSPTLIYCEKYPPANTNSIEYIKIKFGDHAIFEVLSDLAKRNLSTVLVEGGAHLLKELVKADLWDEARVLIGDKKLVHGKRAPVLPVLPRATYPLDGNELQVFFHPRHGISKVVGKR